MEVEQLAGGVRYCLPGRRPIYAWFFLAWMLFVWGSGEIAALRELIYGESSFFGFVLVPWLMVWTAAGLTIIYLTLEQIIGEEIVTVTRDRLAIKRDVVGFERTREYLLAHIQNLRVSGPRPQPWRGGAFGNGLIAFEYAGRTYQFGAGVDEGEAATIVAELNRRQRFDVAVA